MKIRVSSFHVLKQVLLLHSRKPDLQDKDAIYCAVLKLYRSELERKVGVLLIG